eukprot:7889511-Alexandrium_andersonii.AAC.1
MISRSPGHNSRNEGRNARCDSLEGTPRSPHGLEGARKAATGPLWLVLRREWRPESRLSTASWSA